MSYVSRTVLASQCEQIEEKIKNLKAFRQSYLDPEKRLDSLEEKIQKIVTEKLFVLNSRSSQELPTKELYDYLVKELSSSLTGLVKLVRLEKTSFNKTAQSVNTEIKCLEEYLSDLQRIQTEIEEKSERLEEKAEENKTKGKKARRKPGEKPEKIRDVRNYSEDIDK